MVGGYGRIFIKRNHPQFAPCFEGRKWDRVLVVGLLLKFNILIVRYWRGWDLENWILSTT